MGRMSDGFSPPPSLSSSSSSSSSVPSMTVVHYCHFCLFLTLLAAALASAAPLTPEIGWYERCGNRSETQVEFDILDKLLKDYNKLIMPDGKIVEAFVEITINDISRVSELDAFVELDLFYSELWYDRRLAYSHLAGGNCIKNITLDLDYSKRLWMPNICIVNSKTAVIHASPSENVFVILYDDARVWKNCRMMIQAPCTIDLRAFPFDKQECTLRFESYSFHSQRMRLQWFEKDPVTFNKKKELADFLLAGIDVNRSYENYPNGKWDQLTATFTFSRRYGFFIWQGFVPSYMIVFVAWITFFMDPKELATRATMGISAFLAMMLQFGQVQQNQPRVSYIKAMDVWMLGAITFLFVALAELAVISYLIRADRPPRYLKRSSSRWPWPKRAKRFRNGNNNLSVVNGLLRNGGGGGGGGANRRRNSQGPVPRELHCNCHLSHHQLQAKDELAEEMHALAHCAQRRHRWSSLLTAYNVDKCFLIMYLPMFLLFNVVFWSYYLY